jgi:hypothetical protein
MTLAVVTPSYRNDFHLFADLHKSILSKMRESVQHYVLVPARDVGIFEVLTGPRCVIVPEESLYPRNYHSVNWINNILGLFPGFPSHAMISAINTRRLALPVRGWIMQQALKIEMCRRLEADTVLLVDSDVELVRPLDESMLTVGDHARLYRRSTEVDERLPIHMQWHEISRKLLGLAPPNFPAPDYVSSFCVWEPRVVRALVERIERNMKQPWMDAVTGGRTLSEWTIYGVFVEEILGFDAEIFTETSLCHSYWDNIPLTEKSAIEFASQIGPNDVAVLIQSKSKTPRNVRRAALATIESAHSNPLLP